MKLLSRVVWSEGMYLGPQHFQTQSRYFEDSIRFAIEHAWFEPWGLTFYSLDGHAIENGRVSLLNARGVFEDGLVFDMPECDPVPMDCDIKDLFSPVAESLTVLLAVPKRQHGRQNCDLDGVSETVRYHSVNRTIKDVNNGADEKDIRLGQKNIRLITENEPQDDLETIPLARIKRDGAGHLKYDPTFIPPCTKLTASARLMALLNQLIEIFEEKRAALMVPRGKPGKFQSGTSQLDVENFWFLHSVNNGLAVLRHLYAAKRGHPEELFQELSRLAGALRTFSLEAVPTESPVYNHRQLDRCFQSLITQIRQHLETWVPSNAVTIELRQTSKNFFVGDVNDKRCFGRSRWLLAMASSAGEAQVMTKATYLVKVCSAVFVGELVKRAMPGLSLVHMSPPPAALSPKVEMEYFSISKSGPCWEHMQQSQQIGVYVPDELPNPIVELHVILES
jgi:type VI secretion system protein ImpJ